MPLVPPPTPLLFKGRRDATLSMVLEYSINTKKNLLILRYCFLFGDVHVIQGIFSLSVLR